MGARRRGFLQRGVRPIPGFLLSFLGPSIFFLHRWLRFTGRTV
jgi:hypothetical protein